MKPVVFEELSKSIFYFPQDICLSDPEATSAFILRPGKDDEYALKQRKFRLYERALQASACRLILLRTSLLKMF